LNIAIELLKRGSLGGNEAAPRISHSTRRIICKEMKMDSPTHDLKGLFDQLGLDSSEKAIDDFIARHSPLADDKKLIDAEFWTPQQAGFLKEQLREDADWAHVVDDLNLRMHQIH
jgi:hypothetical protein